MQSFIKRYVPLAMLMVLFSEIHFYPLSGTLRLSLGIVFIHLITLIRDDIRLPLLTVSSGLLIGAVRYLGQITIMGAIPSQAFIFVRPALFYYGCFAFLHFVIDIRKKRSNMFSCIIILAAIDAFSNSLEAILRQNMNLKLLQIVILAGLLRALIAFIIYVFWERQSLFIQNQEHQKRYVQLTSLAADVETELFYLRKSSDQIESVMRQSYNLYEELPENLSSKSKALEIAREIHEIKKDYLRVISGFDNFIKNLENIEALSTTEILTIVKSSSEKSIRSAEKDIQLSFQQSGNCMIKHYLNIFTILNNLIDNSIAASHLKGKILVSVLVNKQDLLISVKDDGSGVPSSLQEVIFNPGFTTKYDSITGKASTGIGLSHVNNLVQEMDGSIDLSSNEKSGTCFVIRLPLENICNPTQEV